MDEGEAAEGVKLLLRAYDRRPRDVDAMTCLGQGYAKQGKNGTALTFYERVLDDEDLAGLDDEPVGVRRERDVVAELAHGDPHLGHVREVDRDRFGGGRCGREGGEGEGEEAHREAESRPRRKSAMRRRSASGTAE